MNAPTIRQSFCRVCNAGTTLEQITDTDYNGYVPSYQFPVEAAQIALFVRAAGGTDVDIFDEEVLAGYVTARVGQQIGERA